MSFDRLDSLESQPTTLRRADDPHYRDDPEFDRLTESLSNRLFTLTSNITRLSDQIALLGTRRDTERVRERVHNLLEQTRLGFKDVGEGIKKVTTWEDVNPSQKWTQQKLSSEFRATLEEFQTVQRRALEKQRASAVAARTAVEDGEHAAEDGFQQQQEQLLEQQPRLANQDEVDFQESLIIEREAEIRNIEQSVGELNELFRDVAHIVHEQGGQLDIISENVERVGDDTRGANVELRSASRYQKNARNKACCLLVILAVILLIIVLAVVLG
ncbi:SNAP receptor PEP12 [Aspergillus aculeatinus CBS 121060]|uniref:SNARE domain protein n=3 Tax=Aspergillus TaxID=5052 RepID=A0A8G1W1A7_9EURO|nr:SNARE domain protein [Aspergillus brunneoviolaceus CBS 621.78]XP_025508142.1 SNARE domain protein [Aspergillus aculeatinus CBS 121060]XP_040804740.1 SNARE domain protein [Aspergillus fijiensis CBS 313.89]RAH41605.1 SNARE domain protein [Aspergillus brunneoviolaceus CBS 621.78]RAH74319.1 SNARE domain protein [Aspergillus aculeatinus CBS 121060]RAK80730.1 SNARE domain protein [Aspergillus fijiensis CBS 313.89]